MNESSLLPDWEGTYFKKKNCTHLGKSSWESCREVFTPPALGKSSLCLVWVLSPKQKRQEVDKPFYFFPYWTVVLQ